MMKCSLLLVCYYLLILTQGGDAYECAGLDSEQLKRLLNLTVKDDVQKQLVGSSQDVWGAKAYADKDPNTCIKHTRELVDDVLLKQTVTAKGEWFGTGEHVRKGYLMKDENHVYLETLPDPNNGTHLELAKVYVLYANNGVIGYFWCTLFEERAASKREYLTRLAGITVHPDLIDDPNVKTNVQEAVKKIKAHEDIFGEIAQMTTKAC